MTATLSRPRGPEATHASGCSTRLDAAELCVHALAQVRDDIHLEVPLRSEGVDLASVVDAYGVRHRVRLGGTVAACRFTGPDWEMCFEDEQVRRLTLAQVVEDLSSRAGTAIDRQRGDELLAGHRIVLITNYPTHYRLPLFEAMAHATETVGADFTVVFLAATARSRPWLAGTSSRFDHAFVPSVQLPLRRHKGPLLPAGLERQLRSHRPTIVLSAGLSPLVSERAERVARDVGATFGIWSGETDQTAARRTTLANRLRRRLVARADFAVTYGSRSASYLRGLSPTLPIVIGRNTAPVDVTSRRAARNGFGDEVRLAVIGDLADRRKGVDIALAALRLLPDHPLELSVIGGGRLLGTLAESASSDPRITFLGALAPSDVAQTLAETDLLLFPTRSDVFGLALVEAMGACVTPVVSRAAGSVDDLAVDGRNAVVVDGHDPKTWAAAIEEVTVDPERLGAIARSARETIAARWTVGHAARAMLAGLSLGALVRERAPA